VPVAAKVVAPLRRDAWQKTTDVALGAVWLLRRGERVACYSSTCPHAGCFIDYEEKERRFLCPCHGSTFNLDGQRIAGPAPRDMDTLATAVKAGKVLVRFQRFRQATPKKVAL
jgi:Rieske Fe-S protein